jgi:hypothetical protein
MHGYLREERPTVHGGMGPLGLATKMWRLEGIVYNESVIAPGGTRLINNSWINNPESDNVSIYLFKMLINPDLFFIIQKYTHFDMD